MTDRNQVDIKENDVLRYDRQLLTILLKDNITKQNIIWATDNYASCGSEYSVNEQIAIPLISGKNGNIIKPRVEKNKKEQIARVRDKAEVFTPSWICNKQNNLVDKSWFEAEDIFRRTYTTALLRKASYIISQEVKTQKSKAIHGLVSLSL